MKRAIWAGLAAMTIVGALKKLLFAPEENKAKTITRAAAQEQFLDFVRHRDPEEIGFRLDMWQLWPKCDGEHRDDGSRLFECFNPGLHVELDAPSSQPFALMMGPWELARSDSLDDLYEFMVESVRIVVAFVNEHIHLLGFPCHDECESCMA